MKMLRSQAGEVRSEAEWNQWLNEFWDEVAKADIREMCPRPADAWDRMIRVLKLKEVDHGHSKVFNISTMPISSI